MRASDLRFLLVLGAILLTMTVAVWPRAGVEAGAGKEAPIRLRAATFVPAHGEPPVAVALRARRLGEGSRGMWLVQFTGPVRSGWKDAVAATGAELVEYVPDFAFKVRMTPAQSRRVRALAAVRWVGAFHPAYKLSPRLLRGGERLYVVRLERGGHMARAASAITASGAHVAGRVGRTLVVTARPEQLDALAGVDDVGWIENFVLRKKHNEYGGGVILGGEEARLAGYDGSTQTVGVADTGLGGGTPASAHPDIVSDRITAIFNRPGQAGGCFQTVVDDGARDVDTGHGTHTTVSALGAGDPSGRGRGMAPAAHLVFQAVESYATISSLCQLLYGYPNGYYLTGLPTDLRQLFQQAYDAGARIHSNSWGASVAGQYTADSANADSFVWTHRDLTITFSAGNDGTDADGNGGVDGDSMDAPATAKNVIAVGASENDRGSDYACDATKNAVCAANGGQNDLLTYGEAWPFDFPAAPLYGDPLAGNPEQMAAFSSRGPTDDGRIKPDVVAPGTWVLSGYSDLYQEGYDAQPNPQTGLFQYDGWGYPPSDRYKYMGGTSMANPLVAGGAAVVRDFYQKTEAHAASAALVKATLVNSAVDLLDENNDGVNDNAMAIPNVYEGWGRVNVAAATDGSRLFRDEETPLATGETSTYSYDVGAGTPFKVTLAWTDYPGTQSATRMLVNDLDLEVTSPSGVLYRGNVFGRGWSSWGGLPDRVNNVENVFIQSPEAGNWTVTVRAYNVPMGPQPFALVVAGQAGSGPADTPPSVQITSPPDGADVSGTVDITADASDDVGVAQVEFLVDGTSIGVDTTSPWGLSWDTATVTAGAHVIRAIASDTVGQTAESMVTVNVPVADAPPTVTLTAPASGATLSGTVTVTADASDDVGVAQVEFLVDGASIGVATTAPWAMSWDTTTVADGLHTVQVVATDTALQTSQDAVSVTVQNVTAPTSMHVSDLDGTGAVFWFWWRATVTIAVSDDQGHAVAGATVLGTWSPGGGASCVTGALGRCSVTVTLRRREHSTQWTVTGVTHASLTYQPGANTDPDGDSNGTAITVPRP
jgi:serine protease AprX